MKKSKTLKVILVIVVSFLMLFNARQVFAADNSFKDLTLDNNNVTENKSTTTSGNGNSTTGNKANESNVLKTNNTSNYNNSTLPKTGISETTSAVIFVVVLGISAVYAYKKVQYYKNI